MIRKENRKCQGNTEVRIWPRRRREDFLEEGKIQLSGSHVSESGREEKRRKFPDSQQKRQ